MEYILPLSKTQLRLYVAVSGALVLLVCGLTTFFFQYAVTVAPGLQGVFITALWICLPGLWIIGAFIAYSNHSTTKYILTDQTLIVRKKGWFGRGVEQLYRYDTILSVHSLSRAYGAYGSIELAIRYQKVPLLLNHIESPDEQARRIKELVNNTKKV